MAQEKLSDIYSLVEEHLKQSDETGPIMRILGTKGYDAVAFRETQGLTIQTTIRWGKKGMNKMNHSLSRIAFKPDGKVIITKTAKTMDQLKKLDTAYKEGVTQQ